MIKRPGCCCKREALCTECGLITCFKCGKPWHEGKACEKDEGLSLDPTLARYLLVAECIKCKVPITKNGACNHMTCSRCGAEFCWICRGEYRSHPKPSPNNISFKLGCIFLMGDTAITWLFVMIIGLIIFSPFHIFVEINLMLGHALRKLCMENASQYLNSGSNRETRIAGGTMMFMGLSLLPVSLAMFCVLYPLVVLCRLWQILYIFFVNVLGQCLRKTFCCCCY